MRRAMWSAVLAATLACAALPLAAQDAASLDQVDSLIGAGRTDAARAALTDWLDAKRTRSRAETQRAIWQRALLTVDPSQAATDYQRLVVEYPGGPFSDRALLRLAQAAQADGDATRARSLIASLMRDYPASPARLEASALLESLPSVSSGPGANGGTAAVQESAATPESSVPAPSVRDPVPAPREVVVAAEPEPEAKPAAKSDGDAKTSSKAAAPASAKGGAKPPAKAPPKPAPKAPVKEPAKTPAKETAKAPAPKTEQPPADTAPASTPKPTPKTPAAAAGRWTVQIGAFASPDRATTMKQELGGSGINARLVLVPGSRLIRVRVGRFVTQAEAERERDRLAASDLPATVAGDADREEAAR